MTASELPMPLTAGESLSDLARRRSGLADAEITRLGAIARRAASSGAEQLMKHYGRLSQIRQKSRAGDLVTEADLAAEAAVLAVLKLETAGVGVLAEESGRRPGRGQLEWCVDPLDGTTNYAHSYPFFACSVGLTWDGLPLLGAVAVPALAELFWAAPGQGAWCNDKPLQVSPCTSLEQALLVTGFAYDRRERLDNNYAEFAWFTHRSQGVRRGGAAAVDLAFVAAGRLDGYWERGLSPWDLAAGVVLVEQAGGMVSSYEGAALQISDGQLIACTPGLHGALVEGLGRCQPLPGRAYGAAELDGPDPVTP